MGVKQVHLSHFAPWTRANASDIASRISPLALLRPFFIKLRDKKKLRELQSELLQILRKIGMDHSLDVNVPVFSSINPEAQRIFRASLKEHLFGWNGLLSLRIRLSLVDFCQVSS